MTDETTTSPEVMAGDVITQPGLYKSRGGDIVRITGWDKGWWVSEWRGTVDWYGSDGRQRFRGALDTGRWDLLHWVGPLPASEPEPETTSEQLAEIEGQPEPQPPAEPVQVREGRWKTRDGEVRNVTPTPEGDGRAERFPWWDAAYRQTWCANGKYHFDADSPLDLDTYLGRIEPQPQPQPEEQATDYAPPEGWRLLEVGETLTLGDEIVQSDDGRRYPTERVGSIVVANQRYIRRIEPQPEEQPQPRPQPVQVREGRWQTRDGKVRDVTAMPTDHDDFSPEYPWWDGYVTTWANDGVFFSDQTTANDLVEYLGPIESEPEQEFKPYTFASYIVGDKSQPDALRIVWATEEWIQHANFGIVHRMSDLKFFGNDTFTPDQFSVNLKVQ